MINEIKGNELYFAKIREGAKIPSKRIEDAGMDIYACFDEDYMKIEPHTTKMIPTGICSAFSEDYVAILKERGSTGTKGIAQRCGVVDSGYRNEWLCPITNTTDKLLIIAKDTKRFESGYNVLVYPYTKAISQCLIVPVPKMEVKELFTEELQQIPSERGMGKLGSSGK